ncbi:MAG: cysteine desulfurase family protein [Rubricoccaceae bacterium]
MSVYLDYAATTPLEPAVLEAMLPLLRGEAANPSSVHGPGRRARVRLEEARERVAAVLGCAPAEIVFTSGGTEADNLALRGVLGARAAEGRTGLVASAAEHDAVRRTAEALAEAGADVRLLPPATHGALTADLVAEEADARTALVSAMYVNNETGVVTDLPALAEAARRAGALLHTDAVQAPGLLPLRVDDLGVDLLALSAHKFGGPVGVGVLYVRQGTPLAPVLTGGAQERRRRGGTENVAGAVGLAEALARAEDARAETAPRLAALRDRLAAQVAALVPAGGVRFNTPLEGYACAPHACAPHILNVSFPPPGAAPLDGEMLLLGLDLEGVQVSAGSACTSGALEPSHVLRALGVPRETAQATVRFSLGRPTTEADVEAAAAALGRVLQRLGALG